MAKQNDLPSYSWGFITGELKKYVIPIIASAILAILFSIIIVAAFGASKGDLASTRTELKTGQDVSQKNLQTALGNFQTTMTSYQTSIKSQQDSNAQQLTTFNNQIVTMNKNITDLKSLLETYATKQNVKDQVNEVSVTAQSLNSSLTKLMADVKTLQGAIDTMTAQGRQLAQNTADINLLQNRIDNLLSQVSSLQNQLSIHIATK